MKATRIDIKNFRGIKDLTIEFDPRINVFIGENGTGKTAVLDAIAAMLSPGSDRKMTESDISNDEEFSSISLSCKTGDGVVERESRMSRNGEDDVHDGVDVGRVPDLVEFMEWFYEMECAVGNDDKLESVVYALREFLPDIYDINVVPDPLRIIVVNRNGDTYDMCQLSGGELSIIEIVGVLAMRMVINYPKPGNALSGSGVVLIDEIDMHLHPKWQMMILPKLLEIFPYCQFIISTNSPHVITHVHPENLFLLKRTDSGIVVEKPYESYGKNADRVLEDIMGLETTRPDEVASDLHILFETIDEGKLDEAKDQIVRLMSKIGIDPELVKAGVLIQRVKAIGK